MKWIAISALLLFFSPFSLSAQMSSKKVGIEFANTKSLNLKAVYSVNEIKKPEVNYIVSKSKFEVPINYESSQNLSPDYELDTDLEDLEFQNLSLSGLQSYNIFTIIDLNTISVVTNLDDEYYLSPDFKKFLPEGFNPYHGMFKENFNSLRNPITSR